MDTSQIILSAGVEDAERTRLLFSSSSEGGSTSFSTSRSSSRGHKSSFTIFSTGGAVSWRNVKLSMWRRLPRTRPVIYVLLIHLFQYFGYQLLAEQNSVHIFQNQDQDQRWSNTIFSVGIYGFPALFYPIGGILGDVYFGRKLMSRICLFIIWFFSILLTINFTICSYVSKDNVAFNVVLPIVFLGIIGIFEGIFEINLLTYGAGQLCNSPTEEVSSFIYMWYWTKNLAAVFGIFSITGFREISTAIAGRSGFPPLAAATALTVALLLHRACQDNFETESRNRNPIRHICGVLCNAAHSRPRHQFISAFRYGEDPPSGLEYARQYHGGKYTDEQVQDVRSFGRVLLVILTLSGFVSTYGAYLSMSNYQVKKEISHDERKYFLFHQLSSVTVYSVVVLLIPLLNNLIFPLLSNYLPNSRKRIGFGLSFGLLSVLLAAFLGSQSSDNELLYLLISSVVMGIAETSVFVPILEFVYAQSPDNMKGLLIGCHYFLIGVWSTVVSVIYFSLKNHNMKENDDVYNTPMWYYVSYSVVSLVGLILFCVVSLFYRNRQRNNPISDIMRISMYYR